MNHQVLTFAPLPKPKQMKRSDEVIGVIGLGYVGLPLAIELADKFETVIGFDTNPKRILEVDGGYDQTHEIPSTRLAESSLLSSYSAATLADTTCFIVTVPTPLNEYNTPDLLYIEAACATVAHYIKPGGLVIFESTVYPGVTENTCVPLIEEYSGLTHLKDFSVAYSPERINPGDPNNKIGTTVKLVSADTAETTDRVMSIYREVVEAGLHKCPSIKVAEAAKALENTQRDVNIALMNEMSEICSKIGVSTKDVIEAAATKWNFTPYTPGLVGGHCIGVDPHYLRSLAEQKGLEASVIRNARRVNEAVPKRVLDEILRETAALGRTPRLAFLGLTFKENVPDIRNSLALSLAKDISKIWPASQFVDPVLVRAETTIEGLKIQKELIASELDIIVLAVPHDTMIERFNLKDVLAPAGLLIDVKSAISDKVMSERLRIWSL